ncbi:MAG: SOS response-associated peptidase [Pseudomonadota bacterium]
MCGRFAFYSAAEAVSDLFGVNDAGLAVTPQYNIAPTDLAAVIRLTPAGERELTMLRWGLVPFWSKDRKAASRMINARRETVAEKPAFRKAFRERRCIVPADGYYEWVAGESGKQPYYLSSRDDRPLGFAGLWERWREPQTQQSLETFSVLTMPSAGHIANLHHRMPVMLDDVTAEHWLVGGEQQNPPALRELGAEGRADQLRFWPVAKTVNNARNEDPRLIEPLPDAEID